MKASLRGEVKGEVRGEVRGAKYMFLCIHKTDYASRKATKYPKKIMHKINFEKLASDDPRISDSNIYIQIVLIVKSFGINNSLWHLFGQYILSFPFQRKKN